MHLGLFFKIKKALLFQTLTLACNINFEAVAVMCRFFTPRERNGATRPVFYKLQKRFWRGLAFCPCQPGVEESWWSSLADEGNASVPVLIRRSTQPMRGKSWTVGVYCGLFAFGLYKDGIRSPVASVRLLSSIHPKCERGSKQRWICNSNLYCRNVVWI